MPKKATSYRIIMVERTDGSFAYTVPSTAHVTLYAGKMKIGEQFTSQWEPACQLRIYLGTKLIGFVPNVREFYFIDSMAVQPLQPKEPLVQPQDIFQERAAEKAAQMGAHYGMGKPLKLSELTKVFQDHIKSVK